MELLSFYKEYDKLLESNLYKIYFNFEINDIEIDFLEILEDKKSKNKIKNFYKINFSNVSFFNYKCDYYRNNDWDSVKISGVTLKEIERGFKLLLDIFDSELLIEFEKADLLLLQSEKE